MGYDSSSYTLNAVRYNGGPGSFGGLGYVGGAGIWLKSSSAGVAAHEWGHNLGMWHGNFWSAVNDGVIGPGSNSEYGDSFDIMGSTEGGMGSNITTRANATETAQFNLNPNVKVFTDDGREVAPGSGEIGMIATTGNVPIGFHYKDPEKSERTFRTVNGVRYSFPGDYARVAADGSITLLGRWQWRKTYCSVICNTIRRAPLCGFTRLLSGGLWTATLRTTITTRAT